MMSPYLLILMQPPCGYGALLSACLFLQMVQVIAAAAFPTSTAKAEEHLERLKELRDNTIFRSLAALCQADVSQEEASKLSKVTCLLQIWATEDRCLFCNLHKMIQALVNSQIILQLVKCTPRDNCQREALPWIALLQSRLAYLQYVSQLRRTSCSAWGLRDPWGTLPGHCAPS